MKEPEFKWLPTSVLKSLENNPRYIKDKDFYDLTDSIKNDKNFFLQRPCLVNYTNGEYIVYAGSQRLKAAKYLGWSEVPCFVETNLSKEVMEERVLRDNLHSGRWDKDKLANEWEKVMEKVKFPDIDFQAADEHFKQLKEELERETAERKAEANEGSYTLKTTLVFENEEQQQAYNGFIKYLKRKYKEAETTAERLQIFIKDNNYYA